MNAVPLARLSLLVRILPQDFKMFQQKKEASSHYPSDESKAGFSHIFHISEVGFKRHGRPIKHVLLFACCQRIFRKSLTSVVLARYNMRNERRWCVNGPTTKLHRQCEDVSHLPDER